MTRSAAALALLGTLLLATCSRRSDLESLQRILDDDRRAHLETDAGLLVSHLADTLVSVDEGAVSHLARRDVEMRFRRVFDGATYHAWDDVEPPIVRLSQQRDMAWVVRHVRVDREHRGPGGSRVRRQFVAAWTATYERTQGDWRLTCVTSTFGRDGVAERILAAAERRLGRLDAVRATARVQGPRDRFQVTVRSLRDGRARLDFAGGPSAAIDSADQWIVEAPGQAPAALGPEMATFVRGHEVHMTLLSPGSRDLDLRYGGVTTFGSVPALRLSGVDALGGAFDIFYTTADTLPIGYRVIDHVRRGPSPVVEVDEWADAGGLRLFRRATFRQGDEVFVYRFVDIEPAVADADSVFTRPR